MKDPGGKPGKCCYTQKGFRAWGFKGLGFKGLGFRGLGFKGLRV